MYNRRDYQQTAIDDILNSYDRGVQSGVLVMATGMGKTFTTTELVKEFTTRHGGRALFLVDQIELAEQSREAFLRTDPELRVGIEMNTQRAKPSDQIVIACVASIGRKGSKRVARFDSSEFSAVIADEAHKSVSDIWLRGLHYFGVHPDNYDDGKLLLGLTATPNRTDGVSLGYLYDDIYGNYDIVYGINNGWLTDIEWLPIETGVDVSQVKRSGVEFNQTDLDHTLDSEFRNTAILKAYLDYGGGLSTMIFCASVRHAYKMADMFNAAGITAACVEGGTEKNERARITADFRAGRIKVVTNYSALGTGFDAPETGCIIFARPIRSLLSYTQFLGRGLRPSSTAFVDLIGSAKDRKELIANSIKPACKVIDMCDFVGNHNVCRVPSLFGLNPLMKVEKPKFYSEVVEPLEEIRHEKQIDVSKAVSLEEVQLMVRERKIKIQSYEVDDIVKDMSALSWLKTTDDSYELVFKGGKAMLIEKNLVEKYDVILMDLKQKINLKLNTLNSLSGAFKVADQYAKDNFDLTFLANEEKWKGKGVTQGQANTITRRYKNGAIFRKDRYPDTGVRHLYLRRGKELLFIKDSGMASEIIRHMNKK
jgi:ATP-dependent helicase IRC3